MLFNSLQYAVFLPLALAVYYASPKQWRIHVLLVESYVFYASWSAPYAALMFALAVSNYLFGLALGRIARRRRAALAAFIAFDLGILAFFKYFNFAADTAASLAQFMSGSVVRPLALDVILPLGISFFTFEFIHYLVDIYRGEVPVHSFSRFHVFAAFFPTQIAGPIKRFEQFVPALDRIGKVNWGLVQDGLRLIALGLFKKIILADGIAPTANAGFAAAGIGALGTAEAWAAAIAFALQIYFDFSGYTDIARGSAQLFGFTIPPNFNAPYLATSVVDFWHRWHISLSTWLRDYLYIPLGGSRRGLPATMRNLVITMTLGGLWHGAAWHFVLWGAFWGVVMALARLSSARLPMPRIAPLGWLVTQVVVLVGWVLFRAPDLTTAGRMLRAMSTLQANAGVLTDTMITNVLIVAATMVAVSAAERGGWSRVIPVRVRPFALGVATSLGAAYVLLGEAAIDQRFIYFQF
jgi:alginate O-acetyltransferase complex protein AlgI